MEHATLMNGYIGIRPMNTETRGAVDLDRPAAIAHGYRA